jgi:hypothetical protein
MALIIVAMITLILNIPFGYWRTHVRKFSPYWFMAVHLPIPFVVIMRLYFGLGFKVITYLVILPAYFLGQFIGSKLYKRQELKSSLKVN